MRDKSHKTSAKRETRRLERKSERQATRAVLRGDHSSQPLSSNWGYKPEPVILSDDAKVVAPRGNTKGKSKRCKRNKNGPHVPVHMVHPNRVWMTGYVCEKCGKRLWGYKRPTGSPPEHRIPHWDTTNIWLRLAGHPCPCQGCVDKRNDT